MVFVSLFPKFVASFFSLDLVKKVDHLDLNKTVHFANNKLTLLYPCDSTTVCTPFRIILPKGKYQFEVWGANGGNTNLHSGGLGGYSSGYITFSNPALIYVTVGGKGSHSEIKMQPEKGGYNGGGDGWYLSEAYHGAGGGGASDIRIKQNTLFHRVIVAGGGGGAGGKGSSNLELPGGSGGGKEGVAGIYHPEEDQYPYYCLVSGGNETHRGYNRYYTGNGQFIYQNAVSFVKNASFGYGGSFIKTDGTGWASAGGGAGWFGGSNGCVHGSSGAGGSGYVFSENSIKPPLYGLNNEYFMTNPKLENGGSPLIPDVSWNKEISTNGNGAARITFVDVSFEPRILIATCKIWNHFRGKIMISIIICCS